MSNWEPGDLALCIHDHDCFDELPADWAPKVGGVYTVAYYCPVEEGMELQEDPHKFHPLGWWHAPFFVKVTPGADIEGIEEPKKLHEWGLTTSTNCFTGKSSATETTNDRPHHRPRSPQALS